MPALSEIIGRAVAALARTPIEEQVARTSQELLEHPRPIPQRAPDIPFAGSAARKPFIRATEGPQPKTVWDKVQEMKTAIGGAFTAEPNAPKAIKDLFHTARMKADEAQEAADELIYTRVGKVLSGDVRTKATLLSDYVTQLSDYSDLSAKLNKNPNGAYTGLGGATADQVERDLQATAKEVAKNPDVVLAHKAFRNLMDETFDVMRAHGYVTDAQYRAEYTPVQRLELAVTNLSKLRGTEEAGGKVLAAMRQRNAVGTLRETNIFKATRRVLSDLHEKIAEDELVNKILDDPTLNRTDDFPEGAILPQGWSRYTPGPGMPGWAVGDDVEGGTLGVIDGLEPTASTRTPGSMVLPTDLANRLRTFRKARPESDVARNVYHAGRMYAKWLTVGNPANTGLNIPSDFVTGMMGLPGEKSLIPGYLAFAPASYKAALRGAFGREEELFRRAEAAGIMKATLVESVTGEKVPEKMAQLVGEAAKPQSPYMNFMERLRRGLEAGPRIAGGLAAEQAALRRGATPTAATGEFERVGQALTLDFGAGAPAYTRHPLLAFAAPFLRFFGLATERTVKLLTEKGSRGRAWASVVAVPAAAAAWNYQNAAFEQVEHSIPKYDRNSLHIIIPDPTNPSVPMKDRNGKPVVLRFRYFLPEEVLRTFGLGNLPSRLLEMAQGRQGIKEFAGDVGAGMAEGVLGQLVPAQTAVQVGMGRNLLTGEKESRLALAAESIPLVRQAININRAVINEPDAAGVVRRAMEEVAGVRFATVQRKGRADADILEVQGQLNDAKKKRTAALRRGDTAIADEQYNEIKRLQNRIRAIAAARRKARASQ